MENIITNCGLIALRNIDELKNISIRTILNLAEDNNVILYPYKIALSDFDTIALPAIFHSENHFEYISEKAQLKDKAFSGFVLTTKKYDFPKISEHFTSTIIGQTWVAAGIASGAATNAVVMYAKKRRDAKRDAANRPQYNIPSYYKDNLNIANQIALEGLPASVKNHWENSINQKWAADNQGYANLNSGLRGIAQSTAIANDAQANLEGADAQAKLEGKKMVMGANGALADQTALSWQLNTLNPYYENIASRNQRDRVLSEGLNSAGMMAAGSGMEGKAKTPNTTQGTGGGGFDIYNKTPSYGNNPYADKEYSDYASSIEAKQGMMYDEWKYNH
jgi:hypothetical protein